jgi:hypothetical protein
MALYLKRRFVGENEIASAKYRCIAPIFSVVFEGFLFVSNPTVIAWYSSGEIAGADCFSMGAC